MELEVNDVIQIEDGVHKGVIVDVEYREKPYEYTDIVIEFKVKDKAIRLKAGYATYISMNSKLGKLLFKFGGILDVGKSLDPNKVLIGKKCLFQTVTDGKYSNVLPESVKPI